jgi:hypothetical protein
MRRPGRFRSLATALALMGMSSGAWAGGDFVDEPRLALVTSTWARQGAGAIPAQIRALCSSDFLLGQRAAEMLVETGAMAVAPLLDRAVTGHCEADALERVAAEIVCSAPAEPDAPATRRLRTALAPIVRALEGRVQRRRLGALQVLSRVPAVDACSNERAVFEATAPAVLAALERLASRGRVDGDEFVDLLDRLSDWRDLALPALPRLLKLLDEPALNARSLNGPSPISAILRAVGAMGSGAASAVPKLSDQLAGDHAASAASALGEIGRASAPALPLLTALLRRSVALGCSGTPRTIDFASPVAAVAAQSPDPAATEALVAAFELCCRDEKTLARALGTLRDPAAIPALVTRVREPDRVFVTRLDLVAEIRRIGAPLAAADERYVASLERKDSLRSPLGPAGTGQGMAGGIRMPADGRSAWARYELSLCEREAGAVAPVVDFAALQPDGVERFSACLRERPCGPAREELKAALGACCRLAFPASAPAWCSP